MSWTRTLAGARKRLAEAVDQGEGFDVAVIDLSLPDGDGVELLADLEGVTPQPAVAVVSAHIDSERALQLLGRCLMGVPKPVPTGTFVSLIERLATSRLSGGVSPSIDAYCRACRLSPKETRVLQLYAQGRSRTEIAEELGCQPTTLTSHWNRILEKTGLPSRRQVVSAAWSHGVRHLPIS